MSEKVPWIHHAPGSISGEDHVIRGEFLIEGHLLLRVVGTLDEPVKPFQSEEAFFNYNDLSQLRGVSLGPGARIGPYDIYIPFVDSIGKLVATITGKLVSDVAETSISGTLTLEST